MPVVLVKSDRNAEAALRPLGCEFRTMFKVAEELSATRLKLKLNNLSLGSTSVAAAAAVPTRNDLLVVVGFRSSMGFPLSSGFFWWSVCEPARGRLGAGEAHHAVTAVVIEPGQGHDKAPARHGPGVVMAALGFVERVAPGAGEALPGRGDHVFGKLALARPEPGQWRRRTLSRSTLRTSTGMGCSGSPFG